MVGGRPIFVVGSPRTGTTLMKNVLNGHSEVHLFNEIHFFERIWDQRARWGDLSRAEDLAKAADELHAVARRHGSDSDVAEAFAPDAFRKAVEALGGGYPALLRALLEKAAELHGARHWGDSSPQDVLYLGTLASWYPDVKIIGLVRDPRAFLASYKNYHRRATTSYRERFNPLSNSLLWRSYMTALLAAARGPLAGSVRVTHYEKLVADPEAEVREVCRHVGIAFEPRMLDISGANSSYARGPGARGIHGGSLERWREELSVTEIWLLERICAETMAALDYAPSGAERGLRPHVGELARIFSLAPSRVFNMLFRGNKPFSWNKLRNTLGLLRARSGGGR